MNTLTLRVLLIVPFLLTACVSKRSEVAAKFGYERSSKVQAGPYELHYGKSDAEELLLLAEGNWNILSRDTEQGTAVYLKGVPFLNFEQTATGSVTNLSLKILNDLGQLKTTMIDRDIDGQWDFKIDHALKKTFVWKGGEWAER